MDKKLLLSLYKRLLLRLGNDLYYNGKPIRWAGICGSINNLTRPFYEQNPISYTDYAILMKDFQSRRPTIFSKWWWYPSYTTINTYWWKFTDNGMKQRIKFIESIIKELEDETK